MRQYFLETYKKLPKALNQHNKSLFNNFRTNYLHLKNTKKLSFRNAPNTTPLRNSTLCQTFIKSTPAYRDLV